MKIILIILFIFIVIIFIISYLIFNMALNRYTNKSIVLESDINNKKTKGIIIKEPDINWLKNNSKLISIKTFDNIKLSGYLIKNKSNKFIILVHGYASTHKSLINKAKKFYEMGFSILLYDLRAHGMSEGKYITMGIKDNYDLKEWIKYLIDNYKTNYIGLFGISMGASTVMMSLDNIQSAVKFAIADCGYTSVFDEFKYQLKELFHLPTFPFLYICNLYAKIFANFSFKEISSLTSLSKASVPVLFIQGTNDTFVPYYMLNINYSSCKSKKAKLIVKGANHTEAENLDYNNYWNRITNFINSVK